MLSVWQLHHYFVGLGADQPDPQMLRKLFFCDDTTGSFQYGVLGVENPHVSTVGGGLSIKVVILELKQVGVMGKVLSFVLTGLSTLPASSDGPRGIPDDPEKAKQSRKDMLKIVIPNEPHRLGILQTQPARVPRLETMN